MNKIIVCSKSDFPVYYNQTLLDKEEWCYISIECTDDLVTCGTVDDNDHFLCSAENVLNIKFDDVESDMKFQRWNIPMFAYAITENIADKIVAFAENNFGKNILIHCTAGKSRSQGVAYALWKHYPEYWSPCPENEKNPCVSPNRKVVSEIQSAYLKKHYFQQNL